MAINSLINQITLVSSTLETCRQSTYQFCKNFIGCVQLTVGDYFKPGGYFAHILEDTAPTKKDRGDKKIDLPVKIEVIKKGNFFKLDFS